MAQAQPRRLDSIDVSDPKLYQDDTWRPLFAHLRRNDPVHYCVSSPFGPYWSVTRYDDILAVELDHETYSSASELGGIQIADQPKGQERPNFIRMDPPGHTAQRRTVAPIVAPSNLANFEPLIRRRTADVLDALPRHEVFDWAERVSVDLTNMMLATLFDFPWDDRMKLTFWSDVAIANVDSPDALVHSEEERTAELGSGGIIFVVELDRENVVVARHRPIRPIGRGFAIMHAFVAAQCRKQRPPSVILVDFGIADVNRPQLALRLSHGLLPNPPPPWNAIGRATIE